jgi:hypothetical protein
VTCQKNGPDNSPSPWIGWDAGWMREAIEPLVRSGMAHQLVASLEATLRYDQHKPLPVGVPLKLTDRAGSAVRALAEAYHRLITRIVDLHAKDTRIRKILATPRALTDDLLRSEDIADPQIHLMRIDFLPRMDCSLTIIETNANCPGGLLFAGITSRAWRDVLEDQHKASLLMNPLENEDWLFDWLRETAGQRCMSTVGLLRTDGGNRLELDEYAGVLRRHGIDVFEASPRDVSFDGRTATAHGRQFEVGYQKVGMQDFLQMRPHLDDYIASVLSGALFVPNGQRSRWVGDNKLCLAVLSDPDYADLFEPADYESVQDAIPWSRNLAMCSDAMLSVISRDRQRYVVKHPLDTRGRGVFIGLDAASRGEWDTTIARGAQDNWLVQEYVTTPTLPTAWTLGGHAGIHHDLAVVVAQGTVAGARARSSRDSKVNVAGTGRFHPVFLP